MEIVRVFEIISVLFFIVGFFLLFLCLCKTKNCNNPPKKKKEGHHFAILIPARDESKVIEGILNSIKNQSVSVPFEDVYVIVERKDDPTVSIAHSYGATIVVRKELEKRRKGYALDEAIHLIREHKKTYDAYFIFDADNILDRNYMEEMTKSFDQGYDIGVGYRNCKNGNASWVSACSALTFSMINTLGNESKKKHTETITISGTGFYIRGSLIEEWNGYPFHTLTEDYELTLYATLHGLTTDYNQNAKFYDEQPEKFKTTIPQRTRWIRGYFDSRRIYIPSIRRELSKKEKNYGSQVATYLGVKPYIFMVIGYILLMITQLIRFICFSQMTAFYFILFLFLFLYIALLLVTMFMIKKENGRLNLSRKMQVIAVLWNPFFLATYVHCAIKALLHPNLEWTKVEHHEMMK